MRTTEQQSKGFCKSRIGQLLGLLLMSGFGWFHCSTRAADGVEDAKSADVSDLSFLGNFGLEQLLDLEVTSVAKKEQKLSESPAAIYVITQEEIRRLGVTSIPEALRSVPGVQVAQVNASTWAVSARGFNDAYSNKLLVLVDGRTVYTPTFSGVYWDVQDLILEDLSRIEVIRGPGATLWGANAVNGVINIISKSAKETQGLLLSSAFGTEWQPSLSARFGDQVSSNLFYRVFFKHAEYEDFDSTTGGSALDDWRSTRGGFRLDWEPSTTDLFTLQGDYYEGRIGEQVTKAAAIPPTMATYGVNAPNKGGNVLGRWTHKFSSDSELILQMYYDGYERQHAYGGGSILADPGFLANSIATERRDTFDVDLQHRFALGERHEIMWGTEFRYSDDALASDGAEISLTPSSFRHHLFSAFLQDEIELLPDRLRLTLGSKLEHNDFTGLEFQPGARLMWLPTDKQSIWASVARAVRTPSRVEDGVRANLLSFTLPDGTPAQASVFGNEYLEAEELLAFEIGYRVEPHSRVSVDVAAFYNDYELIGTHREASRFEFFPEPPHLLAEPTSFLNGVDQQTYGVELASEWRVTDIWRWRAGYSWLNTSSDGVIQSQTNPRHQANIGSTLELPRGFEVNAAAYFVDHILSNTSMGTPVRIPSYVRLDLGLTWRPRENLEFSIWGQNLLDDEHPEFASYKATSIAGVPRSVYAKATWRF